MEWLPKFVDLTGSTPDLTGSSLDLTGLAFPSGVTTIIGGFHIIGGKFRWIHKGQGSVRLILVHSVAGSESYDFFPPLLVRVRIRVSLLRLPFRASRPLG